MAARDTAAPDRGPSGRDRILDAAYGLFSRSGVRAIGVDTITAHADVAKMTLYRNFASKNDLALAFLAQREERWTKGWVQAEVLRRADTPVLQLLTIFEIFTEWFGRDDFEGCAFITSLLEFDSHEEPVRQACVKHLANIRAFVAELADTAAAGGWITIDAMALEFIDHQGLEVLARYLSRRAATAVVRCRRNSSVAILIDLLSLPRVRTEVS